MKLQKRTKTKTFNGKRYYYHSGVPQKKHLPLITGFVDGPYRVVKTPYRGVRKHKYLYTVYTKKKKQTM